MTLSEQDGAARMAGSESSCTIRLSLPQFHVMNYLRGTGDYVGRDALPKDKNCHKFLLRTLLNLSKRRLIAHLAAGCYRLTDAGREWHRVGRPLKFQITRWRDEHYNSHVEIKECV